MRYLRKGQMEAFRQRGLLLSQRIEENLDRELKRCLFVEVRYALL